MGEGVVGVGGCGLDVCVECCLCDGGDVMSDCRDERGGWDGRVKR